MLAALALFVVVRVALHVRCVSAQRRLAATQQPATSQFAASQSATSQLAAAAVGPAPAHPALRAPSGPVAPRRVSAPHAVPAHAVARIPGQRTASPRRAARVGASA
jgi:hypothetical protein